MALNDEVDTRVENDDEHSSEYPIENAETQSVNEAHEEVSPVTAPLPVIVEPVEEEEAPEFLYDERLHVKYIFTFYSSPIQVIAFIIIALVALPFAIGLLDSLSEAWTELEEAPVVGMVAQLLRIIAGAFISVLGTLVTTLFNAIAASTVGIVVGCIAALALLGVAAIFIARPIYAWRMSRIRVNFDGIAFFRPGNKFLFLDDDNIRIRDTSIVRGATDIVRVMDKWIFPGAGIVTVDRDDQSGTGDNPPWEPVRRHEELVAAIDQVVAHQKALRDES